MSEQPLFVLINAYTTGLSPTVLATILDRQAPKSGRVSCGEVGLPITQGGGVLPCGMFARWES